MLGIVKATQLLHSTFPPLMTVCENRPIERGCCIHDKSLIILAPLSLCQSTRLDMISLVNGHIPEFRVHSNLMEPTSLMGESELKKFLMNITENAGSFRCPSRVILILMKFRILILACCHVFPTASLVSELFLFSL